MIESAGWQRAQRWLDGPVQAALDAEGWTAEHMDDAVPTLRFMVQGQAGAWRCYIRAWDDTPVLAVYAVFPIDTPPERRAAMAQAVTQANHGLDVGNFEFDSGDGELLFKTTQALGDDSPTAAQVQALLHANIDTMDRFFAGFGAVMYG